jgi:hypothetical protein
LLIAADRSLIKAIVLVVLALPMTELLRAKTTPNNIPIINSTMAISIRVNPFVLFTVALFQNFIDE